MSKTKKTESKFTTWLKNLQEKRRVVVLDEDSFEEKRNFTTSKFSLLVFFLFSYKQVSLGHLYHEHDQHVNGYILQRLD